MQTDAVSSSTSPEELRSAERSYSREPSEATALKLLQALSRADELTWSKCQSLATSQLEAVRSFLSERASDALSFACLEALLGWRKDFPGEGSELTRQVLVELIAESLGTPELPSLDLEVLQDRSFRAMAEAVHCGLDTEAGMRLRDEEELWNAGIEATHGSLQQGLRHLSFLRDSGSLESQVAARLAERVLNLSRP